MIKRVLVILSFVVVVGNCCPAFAQDGASYSGTLTPVQVAIFDPIQLVNSSSSVAGLRLDLIYGSNAEVYGLDLGLWNISDRMGGLEVGIANKAQEAYGIQVGLANAAVSHSGVFQLGVLNGAGPASFGIQAGVINDTVSLTGGAGDFTGIAFGLANISPVQLSPWSSKGLEAFGGATFNGIEISALNVKRRVNGISFGLFNSAERVRGLQAGIVNSAMEVQGVQIGLLNFIRNSSLPFFPGINASW